MSPQMLRLLTFILMLNFMMAQIFTSVLIVISSRHGNIGKIPATISVYFSALLGKLWDSITK